MATTSKTTKPATMRIKSSGGIRHVKTASGVLRLDGEPVEVSSEVGQTLIARGKAVQA